MGYQESIIQMKDKETFQQQYAKYVERSTHGDPVHILSVRKVEKDMDVFKKDELVYIVVGERYFQESAQRLKAGLGLEGVKNIIFTDYYYEQAIMEGKSFHVFLDESFSIVPSYNDKIKAKFIEENPYPNDIVEITKMSMAKLKLKDLKSHCLYTLYDYIAGERLENYNPIEFAFSIRQGELIIAFDFTNSAKFWSDDFTLQNTVLALEETVKKDRRFTLLQSDISDPNYMTISFECATQIIEPNTSLKSAVEVSQRIVDDLWKRTQRILANQIIEKYGLDEEMA